MQLPRRLASDPPSLRRVLAVLQGIAKESTSVDVKHVVVDLRVDRRVATNYVCQRRAADLRETRSSPPAASPSSKCTGCFPVPSMFLYSTEGSPSIVWTCFAYSLRNRTRSHG